MTSAWKLRVSGKVTMSLVLRHMNGGGGRSFPRARLPCLLEHNNLNKRAPRTIFRIISAFEETPRANDEQDEGQDLDTDPKERRGSIEIPPAPPESSTTLRAVLMSPFIFRLAECKRTSLRFRRAFHLLRSRAWA